MEGMFKGCTNLKEVDFPSDGLPNVDKMGDMFKECPNLEKIIPEDLNIKDTTDTDGIFEGGNNLPEPPIKKEYTVDIVGGNGGIVFAETPIISFGKTKNIMVTPNTGYYLESFSCTNGYKNNAVIDISSSEHQIVTIDNNNENQGSTCTATFGMAHYKIEYALDGGTISGTKPTSYTIEDGDVTLPTPTKTGYKFLGWSGSNGAVQTPVVIPSGSTGNKSYTANWQLKSYNVTINKNTGGTTSVSTLGVNYGSSNTFIISPTAGYYINSVSCTNGYTTNATLNTSSSQTVTVSNNNKDATSTCTITFTQSLAGYLTNLAKTDTTNLAADGTTDNNIRYIGSSPNNYVRFNNELWRVIGVMNNVEDSSGTKGSHVKLIRAESIGDYSWNGSGSYGVNDWTNTTKSLRATLNEGPYWNRTSGTCYVGNSGGSGSISKSCNFSSTGLTNEAKGMISNIKWNLGGHNTYKVTASTFYTAERGTTVYSGNPTTWTGYVGLMYPSDYGFAVGGSVRSSCLSKQLYDYNNTCADSDWLYQGGFEWTLSPISNLSYSVFMHSTIVGSTHAYAAESVRPVIYLNSNIKRTGGSGTSSDPFIIG